MSTAYPLGIFTRLLGIRSETFVQRHVEQLLPGGTVVVSRFRPPAGESHWSSPGPTLYLDSSLSLGEHSRNFAERVFAPKLLRGRQRRISRFLKQQQVEVLLGEFLDVSLECLEPAREAGTRFFAHAHGYDVSLRLREECWLRDYPRYAQADGVITMSECSKRTLVELGLPAEKIHVIPYGVDVPAECPVRSPTSPLRCLSVGRLVAKKAPILLLEAFRRASVHHPGLHLDLVGGGALLPAVRQFIHASGLSSAVTVHNACGHQEVKALMQRTDLFLQHSITDPDSGDQEGLPVAILEAMAAAQPVIATRHAGIPEAVQDGVTGFLVDEWDVEGMAQALQTLAGDPERCLAMGRQAWASARESFTWERQRRQLLSVLGLANHPAA